MLGRQLVWARANRAGLMIPFKRTCEEVAALVVAREDRALSLGERAGVRVHMAICKACPRFERQILTMRHALKAWRHYAASGDPDQRPD
jgi:hypothetical protein